MIDVAKCSGRPVGDHSARAQTDNAIGELDRELDLVKTDQNGDHALARNVPQNRKNAPGRFRIEAGDRLIGQDKAALLGERSCDSDALLLAPDKLSARCKA
jgi:hypothetical protein